MQRIKYWPIVAALCLLPWAAAYGGTASQGGSEWGSKGFIPPAAVAAVGGCMSGTYRTGWDGDHTSGVSIACYDSGSSTTEFAVTGENVVVAAAYGQSGNGVRLINSDNKVYWEYDMIDPGTLYIRVRHGQDVARDTNVQLIGVTKGNNCVFVELRSGSSELRAWWYDEVGDDTYEHSAFTQHNFIDDGSTWNTVGVSWNTGESDFAVYLDNGTDSAWEADNENNMDTWPNGYSGASVHIGYGNRGAGNNDTVDFDDFRLVTGYQAAVPW